jgi:hypothetical protein
MKLATKAVTALLLAALMVMALPMSVFAAEDGKVWLTVSEEEDKTVALIAADTQVTDGLVIVTYDSEKLTYEGVKTMEAYVAMHAVNAEEPGVVKISWVAPGPYETNGDVFGIIAVMFKGVEEESTLTINGAIHDDAGNVVTVGEGVDTTALEQAIAEAKAVDKDKYTADSVAALENALAAAEAVLADPLASQEEVDAAAQALRDAIAALKLLDTTALEQAIAAAKAVNKDKYTDETVAALENALAAAEAVLADSLASQEEVDAAAQALRDAIKALKAVDIGNAETGDNGVAIFGMLAVLSALAMTAMVVNKRRYAR